MIRCYTGMWDLVCSEIMGILSVGELADRLTVGIKSVYENTSYFRTAQGTCHETDRAIVTSKPEKIKIRRFRVLSHPFRSIIQSSIAFWEVPPGGRAFVPLVRAVCW